MQIYRQQRVNPSIFFFVLLSENLSSLHISFTSNTDGYFSKYSVNFFRKIHVSFRSIDELSLLHILDDTMQNGAQFLEAKNQFVDFWKFACKFRFVIQYSVLLHLSLLRLLQMVDGLGAKVVDSFT